MLRSKVAAIVAQDDGLRATVLFGLDMKHSGSYSTTMTALSSIDLRQCRLFFTNRWLRLSVLVLRLI